MVQLAERLLIDDEFAALPPDPDGMRMELVCGKVVMAPPPNTSHGDSTGEVFGELRAFVRRHNLGRVATGSGFSFTPDRLNVRAPDAAFISNARLPEGGFRQQGYDQIAPDLCVEVVSPGNTAAAVAEKVDLYLRAGVVRVWVVRPRDRTVTVHRPDGAVELLTGRDVLTSSHAGFEVDGFRLPVDEIFWGAR